MILSIRSFDAKKQDNFMDDFSSSIGPVFDKLIFNYVSG